LYNVWHVTGSSNNIRHSFTIWQLRTSYLSSIKDGIGDRLINVNNSVLNAPEFRAAGWPTTSTGLSAQEMAAQTKRTYSPPIPTTATVSSEYYRHGRHGNGDGGAGLGIAEEPDEDEGGMVTGGGGSTTTFGARLPLRGAKKIRRRERQQSESQRPGEAEEEDSSDLSDESDDDGDGQRFVTRMLS
jgi:hypothetical protein